MLEFNDVEVVQGYCDGLDGNSPEPSANRSASYRHGFANGRDDLRGRARNNAATIRANLMAARAQDAGA